MHRPGCPCSASQCDSDCGWAASLAQPMGRKPLQLPATAPSPPPPPPKFELYEGSAARAREGLQAFLVRVLERCQQGFGVLHTVGRVPRTSIANKLKYYQ